MLLRSNQRDTLTLHLLFKVRFFRLCNDSINSPLGENPKGFFLLRIKKRTNSPLDNLEGGSTYLYKYGESGSSIIYTKYHLEVTQLCSRRLQYLLR